MLATLLAVMFADVAPGTARLIGFMFVAVIVAAFVLADQSWLAWLAGAAPVFYFARGL